MGLCAKMDNKELNQRRAAARRTAWKLAVIAFLTNAVIFLPIIGIVLVIESMSVIIQLASKKLRHGKKVFLAAPIHHHFEALGWSESQITMRFWLVSAIFSGIGLTLYFLSKFLY